MDFKIKFVVLDFGLWYFGFYENKSYNQNKDIEKYLNHNVHLNH